MSPMVTLARTYALTLTLSIPSYPHLPQPPPPSLITPLLFTQVPSSPSKFLLNMEYFYVGSLSWDTKDKVRTFSNKQNT